MLSWITGNVATVVICAVLIAVVAAVIGKIVRDRKKGKSSCGCGCANCAMNGSCHSGK